MNNIGEKIKIVRKKKGLSQEELADLATINLRTIQRIENSESEPRGKTLHLICGVLDLNAEDLLDYGKQTDTSFLVFFYNFFNINDWNLFKNYALRGWTV